MRKWRIKFIRMFRPRENPWQYNKEPNARRIIFQTIDNKYYQGFSSRRSIYVFVSSAGERFDGGSVKKWRYVKKREAK